MIWNFFKSNWFSISCVCMLLMVSINKYRNKLMLPANAVSTQTVAGIEADKSAVEFSLGSDNQVQRQAREVDTEAAGNFLRRFSKVAVSERKKFGIPASVLLGTAFINSHAGLADQVGKSNNYFLIPCDDDWEGDTFAANGVCVRKYSTAWDGWRDFSIFLSGQTWFGALKKSAGKDWKKWVNGMKGEDISNVKDFNRKLAEVITYYKLHELDSAPN